MKILKTKLSSNLAQSKEQNIAIQGFAGSFHQQAAELFFGKAVNIIYYPTFKDLVKVLAHTDRIDGGVMAIENTIAGSIIPNYKLIQQNNLHIIGEVYLKIDQYLLANPGVALSDITQVYTHPMAIHQCQEFLDQFNWEVIETNDTALSAKYIHQHKNKHTASIASKLCSELYELNILSACIQTVKNNFTRFLVLERDRIDRVEVEEPDKASIYFTVNNLHDSLAKILIQFADAKIGLQNLQSVPTSGANFHYGFHADITFSHVRQLYDVLDKIKTYTSQMSISGIYKAAQLPQN